MPHCLMVRRFHIFSRKTLEHITSKEGSGNWHFCLFASIVYNALNTLRGGLIDLCLQ